MKTSLAIILTTLVLVGAGCGAAPSVTTFPEGIIEPSSSVTANEVDSEAFNACMQNAQDVYDKEIARLSENPLTLRGHSKATEDRLRTDRDFCSHTYPHDTGALPPSSLSNTIDKVNKIDLFYNQSTGELYPIFSEETVKPHTCVWTFWGDHGSDMTLTTTAEKGHFITNETDPFIKMNSFLPPRMPIYINCTDWQNNTFQGSLGD